jgi:type II secretory pathway pseudopilin PulG
MPRHAFTLVEVLAAIGAFSLVFLSGTGAIAQLTRTQSTNYQRVVAGTAAMLLADWHATRATQQVPQLDFATNTSSTVPDATRPLRRILAPPALRFVGGDHGAGDAIYVFNPDIVTDGSAAPGTTQLDFTAYRSLILSLSPPTPTPETDSGTYFRQLSFWQGSRSDLLAGRSMTLHFVGRFLIADRCQP